jgi:hypothetical protein
VETERYTDIMRTIALFLAVAMAGSMSAASASKTALLNELIELTHGTDTGMEALIILLMQDDSEPSAAETKALGEELRSDAQLTSEVSKATFEILAAELTEKQLTQLVSFFKSDVGKAYCNAVSVLAKERPVRIVNALAPPDAVERSREKRTMADMRSVAIASEAYATDYNAYPDAQAIEELRPLLSPVYIRTFPNTDAWGTPIAYFVSANKQKYRFVSAGPDEKFDATSLKLGTPPAKSDDIVFEDGSFLLWPASISIED